MTDAELDRVLSLFESGARPEDIVAKFPNHRDEIFDVLRMVEVLARDTESALPPKDFLASVLEHVTETTPARYSKRGVSSIIGSLIYVFDSFAAHARVAVPAVAVVLLIVVFAVNRPGTPSDTLPQITQDVLMQYDENSAATSAAEDSSGAALKLAAPEMMAMQALPPATGNLDDAAMAFSETFVTEEELAAEGDAEIAAFIAEDGADAYQNFYEQDL